jgi:hypothetical protein
MSIRIRWWPETPQDPIWPVWTSWVLVWVIWFCAAFALRSAVLAGIFFICALFSGIVLSYWTWLTMQIRRRDG